MDIKIMQLVTAMECIAPPDLAEPWDPVGLHVGTPTWTLGKTSLLTIDLTSDVLEEAIAKEAGSIIAYHPLIFTPLARLTDESPCQAIALRAARHGIAVYCPHTALDNVSDGINDWLAGGFGKGHIDGLRAHPSLTGSEECKIVTFCPPGNAREIREAMAGAGAGIIGSYKSCSFQSAGTGTYRGDATSSPYAGTPGRLEHTEEVRLEMVSARICLADAVAALRAVHPYEEPPIEIYELQPRPGRGTGGGRRITLAQRCSLRALAVRLQKRLGTTRLHVALGKGTPRLYGSIGVCAGAGGSCVDDAIEQGCEAFLTGEMKHHDIISARERGCTVLLAGHTNTERGYLKILRKSLSRALPGVSFVISRRDRDPLRSL